ncbi:chemotaxis protein CheD [Roseitranquillus sediminis]|uniref:chemotaxis protein CheD n=1 Tax=Roseitranquillus sediminis TaxID=2809051 RepID=UPI001D0C1CF5|nr:chemotaxis protein CheD [Roseitranquillus sediminis]MBM9593053.1 chemotaxis protein CheD [Roseitranquillus sediminis]
MPGSGAEAHEFVQVRQGAHALGRGPDDVVGAILGSCVAACIWDPLAHVGGMNHILLPGRTVSGYVFDGHGACSMERLINALLKEGASRGRLRAKVFGGATMVPGLGDIGARNAAFLEAYLRREGIPCDGGSLGGNRARMVRFWPYTGRARQRLVDRVGEVVAPPKPPGNGVELF